MSKDVFVASEDAVEEPVTPHELSISTGLTLLKKLEAPLGWAVHVPEK